MLRVLLRWQQRARSLKLEAVTLYLACRDPRVPWHAKLVALCVVGYALSPIDLIPDPIPILGYLDDLILIPLGIALAVKLIPAPVLEDCRRQAAKKLAGANRISRIAAGIIILLWIVMIFLIVLIINRLFSRA